MSALAKEKKFEIKQESASNKQIQHNAIHMH